MKQTVDKGKTLLVDGAASVTVISGEAEVFGYPAKNAGKIVIREGKRLPLAVVEKAEFEVFLGENASVEEVDGATTPQSWTAAADAIAGLHKTPVTALIMGKADSGKTSFCTYLINKLLHTKQKVVVLDGDLGQSDIGPPGTVAYAFVAKPVTDLFALRAENAFFIGFTSPSEAVDKAAEGVALMKQEIAGRAVDFVVVNTDGWVEGENAVAYKRRLAEALQPDLVFCVQQSGELSPLLEALGNFGVSVVESSAAVRQRSREKRRDLRELGYLKYLAGAKLRTWRLRLLEVEEENGAQRMRMLEEDVLLGLYDAQRRFLGIGVLRRVDYARKTVKVLTPVSVKPASIAVGGVKLDENLKEFETMF